MYQTLLDDLQPAAETDSETITLTQTGVEAVDVDQPEDDLENMPEDLADDDDSDVNQSDSSLLPDEELESWSDDPVRMYLTQMGEIPLLTRKEEIDLAKEIEMTRAEFRRGLLECDYVIRMAFTVLKRVHAGELPFDRTVQVSVTDRLEKDQILGRLPHNLTSLEVLLRQNRHDYRIASSRSKLSSSRVETKP